MSLTLQQVLKRSDIWQASQKMKSAYSRSPHSVSTHHQSLDQVLHYGGWPINRLTEILVERQNIGEMQIVLPSIAQQMKKGGWLFLIEPPFSPYAPGWLEAKINTQKVIIIRSCQEKDWLWVAEQVMANKAVSCTLFWPPKDYLSNKILKRLQLAAEQGCQLNFIFRSMAVASQSSPASLRLSIKQQKITNIQCRSMAIHILKQAGGWSDQRLVLDCNY